MAITQNENKINAVLKSQVLPALSLYSAAKKRKNEVRGLENGFLILNRSIQTRYIPPSVRNIIPILQFLLNFIRMSMKKIEQEYWWCYCLRTRSEYYRILTTLYGALDSLAHDLLYSPPLRQSDTAARVPVVQPVVQQSVLLTSMDSRANFLGFLSPSPLKHNAFDRVVCLIYHMRLMYRGSNQERLELCSVLEKKTSQLESESRPYLFKAYIVYWTLKEAYKYIASHRQFGSIRWNTRLQKIIKETASQLECHLKSIDPINFRVSHTDSIYQQPYRNNIDNRSPLSSGVQSLTS